MLGKLYNYITLSRWEIKLAIGLGALLNVDSIFDAKRIAKIKQEIDTPIDKQGDIHIQ